MKTKKELRKDLAHATQKLREANREYFVARKEEIRAYRNFLPLLLRTSFKTPELIAANEKLSAATQMVAKAECKQKIWVTKMEKIKNI